MNTLTTTERAVGDEEAGIAKGHTPVGDKVLQLEEEPKQAFNPRNCCQLGIFISLATVFCIIILATVVVIPIMNKFS